MNDFTAFEAAANKGEFTPPTPEAEPEKPAQETSEAPVAEEAQEAKSDADSESADEEGQEQTDKPKGKGGFQRRIDKLTAKIHDLEGRLANPAAPPKTADTQSSAEPAGKPKLEDFDSHTEFVEKLTDWLVEQKLAANKADAEVETKVNAWQKSESTAREKYSDYDDVLESASHIIVPPAIQRALLESDQKAELAYHLAKNHGELERISRLDPLRAAIEIGRIEGALTPTPDKQKPAVSKAPKPAATVTGKAEPPAKKLTDLPFQEFEREANKRFGSRSY